MKEAISIHFETASFLPFALIAFYVTQKSPFQSMP